jgi:hypothetical protein
MGKQLIEEVTTKLTDDLIENVCVPDIRCNRALVGEVSGSSTVEAGAWECVRLGPIKIHRNDHWERGHWSWHK